jgi:hypothetical protein
LYDLRCMDGRAKNILGTTTRTSVVEIEAFNEVDEASFGGAELGVLGRRHAPPEGACHVMSAARPADHAWTPE